MAKRTPITIDLGDETDRPIRYSAAYADGLKEKYGSMKELGNKIDSGDIVFSQIVLDGLVDKAGFTAESIREATDASLQLEIWLKIIEALTGSKIDPPNKRTVDPNALSQTIQ